MLTLGTIIAPDFHPVIPAKAGIQKAADAGDEPKTAANSICQHRPESKDAKVARETNTLEYYL